MKFAKTLLLAVCLLVAAEAGRLPGYSKGTKYGQVSEAFKMGRKSYDKLNFLPGGENITPTTCVTGAPLPYTNPNGTCHNLVNTISGAHGRSKPRNVPNSYVDGLEDPIMGRPSGREISNVISNLPTTVGDYNRKGFTRLQIFTGQFLDHDIALTLECEQNPNEAMPVEIPEGDDVFDVHEFEFFRSEYYYDADGVRAFPNENTQFLDLGTVYGDTQELSDLLREFVGGRMRVEVINGEDFPLLIDGIFTCGDERCFENPMLFSFHTVWLREHNRIAAQLVSEGMTDDQLIWQEARIRNYQQWQSLVWNEYLPNIVGRKKLFDLTGPYAYNESQEAFTFNVFTTACYRWGHTGLPHELAFIDGDQENIISPVPLRTVFENPTIMFATPGRLDAIFNGQSSFRHGVVDAMCVDDIRNFLFENIGEHGDLIARNIQRGRDHGLGTFNQYREAYGLTPYECDADDQIACFRYISRSEDIAEDFEELYGSFDQVDIWPAGLSEPQWEDSLLGETCSTIIVDGINRMRQADRTWYENPDNAARSALLGLPVTLKQIVERNSNVHTIFAGNLMGQQQIFIALLENTRASVEWIEYEEPTGDDVVTTSTLPDGAVTEQGTQYFYMEGLEEDTEYTVNVVRTIAGGTEDLSITFRTLGAETTAPPATTAGAMTSTVSVLLMALLAYLL